MVTTQYANETRLYPAFRVRVWLRETTPGPSPSPQQRHTLDHSTSMTSEDCGPLARATGFGRLGFKY